MGVTLVGDIGGTSSSFRVIHRDGSIEQFGGDGLNIAHDDLEGYLDTLGAKFSNYGNASQLHLYMAGISGDADKEEIRNAFSRTFPKARIEVQSDLLGAARSLCGEGAGWVGILGTGANISHYDGEKLDKRIPGLGFILGDEGSGCHIGKQLLVDFSRGNLPVTLRDQLKSQFDLSEELIVRKTYREPGAKKYLASFARFVSQHQKEPYCYALVYNVFREHLRAFFMEVPQGQVHYTGSIALYFEPILRQAASDAGIAIGTITESPIAGLALYHKPSD